MRDLRRDIRALQDPARAGSARPDAPRRPSRLPDRPFGAEFGPGEIIVVGLLSVAMFAGVFQGLTWVKRADEAGQAPKPIADLWRPPAKAARQPLDDESRDAAAAPKPQLERPLAARNPPPPPTPARQPDRESRSDPPPRRPVAPARAPPPPPPETRSLESGFQVRPAPPTDVAPPRPAPSFEVAPQPPLSPPPQRPDPAAASPAPEPAAPPPPPPPVVSFARPIGGAPRPVYPQRAAERGKEGEVKIRLTISPDGRVKYAEVASETPPNFGFGQAALAAVLRTKFEPKQVDGAPTESEFVYIVRFRTQ